MEFKVEGSVKNRKFAAALMPSIIKQLGLENSTAGVCIFIDGSIGDDNEGTTVNLGIVGIDCFLVLIKPQNLRGSRFTIGHKELAITLAHEMVHVKQMAKGQLKSASRGAQTWMGKRYPASTPYLDRPWEVEAFSRQELIMRRAIED
jgi:hypothetical protein